MDFKGMGFTILLLRRPGKDSTVTKPHSHSVSTGTHDNGRQKRLVRLAYKASG